jgi:hypothetical protein
MTARLLLLTAGLLAALGRGRVGPLWDSSHPLVEGGFRSMA